MLKVYVAGPLSRRGPEKASPAGRQLNVDTALAVGADLVCLGFNPYVPHYNHYMDRLASQDVEEETWLKMDFEWLEKCSVLLRIPGYSPGGDREVAYAKKCGLPVVFSVEELLTWEVAQRVQGGSVQERFERDGYAARAEAAARAAASAFKDAAPYTLPRKREGAPVQTVKQATPETIQRLNELAGKVGQAREGRQGLTVEPNPQIKGVTEGYVTVASPAGREGVVGKSADLKPGFYNAHVLTDGTVILR